MSYTVTVDTSQARALLDQMDGTTADMTEGLMQAVMQTLIPDLEELSSTLFNVRTGMYSLGWEIMSATGNTVIVANTAASLTDGYPYSLSLEFGWKSHAGGFVAQQATEQASQAISGALMDWLTSQFSE